MTERRMKHDQIGGDIDELQQRIAQLEAELSEAQAQLRRADGRYSDLFQNAGESIFIVELATLRIVDANAPALRRFGYSLEELQSLTINQIEVRATGELGAGRVWRSKSSGTNIYECQYRRKDGALVWVEVNSRVLSLAGTHVIVNFVRDLSWRRELERARRNAEAEAKRLAAVIEQATETILITNLDGSILYANPYFEKSTGYTVKEVTGQNPRILKSGNQDGEFYSDLWSTILNGQSWHGTFVNRRKNGEPYYEEATIFPLRDDDGQITHFAAVKRDISERIQSEREREQLISDLDAFSHTVAHDLKSPLSILTGYLGLLREEQHAFPSKDASEMIKWAEHSAHKMGRIIDELLLLASIRMRDEIEVDPLDMRDIVNEAISRLAIDLTQRQSQVEVHEDVPWPLAVGYAPWVEEVWANYISNAIKYGGRPPRVELGADPAEGGMVRFWVRDNGRGLSPDQQAQLFKPFTRINEVRAQGYGLGLSIVQRIITRLGGTVQVESAQGQGSTFSFTLPAFNPDNYR
jgi:PAS domain S-box-containing protein